MPLYPTFCWSVTLLYISFHLATRIPQFHSVRLRKTVQYTLTHQLRQTCHLRAFSPSCNPLHTNSHRVSFLFPSHACSCLIKVLHIKFHHCAYKLLTHEPFPQSIVPHTHLRRFLLSVLSHLLCLNSSIRCTSRHQLNAAPLYRASVRSSSTLLHNNFGPLAWSALLWWVEFHRLFLSLIKMVRYVTPLSCWCHFQILGENGFLWVLI